LPLYTVLLPWKQAIDLFSWWVTKYSVYMTQKQLIKIQHPVSSSIILYPHLHNIVLLKLVESLI